MPKLALHWQIIIGLILGLLVGIVVNLAWGAPVWRSLGVGDASSYLRGAAYQPAKPKRNADAAARAWLLEGLDAVLTGDAPPDRRAAAMALVPEGVVDDQAVDQAEQRLIDAAAWLVHPILPSDLETPPQELVAVEEIRAQLDGSPGASLSLPDDDDLAVAMPMVARLIADRTDGAIIEAARPNADSGVAAAGARFVRNLTEFIGDLFLRLLRFIAVPIVLFSLIVGASSLNDLKKLSRIGGKTIGIYLVTTAVAITVGLLLANIVGPGRGFDEQLRDSLAADKADEAAGKIEAAAAPDVWATVLEIVPTNPFAALAQTEMLQVVFAALVIGIALTLIKKEKAAPIVRFCDGMTDVIIKLVQVILLLAPWAVFALITTVVADSGFAVLRALASYSLVVIVGLAIMMFGIYPLALKIFTPMRYGWYFRGIAPAQLLAFSSASSSATLPVTMECAERNLGVSEKTASFVLPLGATINMDGTALYQGVAAVFIAQLYGLDLTISQQLTIVLTATLASIGTAGVPGVGMIMLVIVLQSVGIPLEGIAVILGVDRILDMCRTSCNVTGDTMVATVVAATEGDLASEEEVKRRRAEPLDEHPLEEGDDQYARDEGPAGVGD